MHKMLSLDEHVLDMKCFGDYLMPFNFPQVPGENEDDINCLKNREVIVDGYTLILHYSKSDYTTHFLETVQVVARNQPFLPFSLVCKVAKRFLGDQHLSLVELFRDNRKIYCWTLVTSRSGKPLPGPFPERTEEGTYQGFEFRRMDPSLVNFY